MPSESKMSDLRAGIIKSSLCTCGDSNHIACIFDYKRTKLQIFSIGINLYHSSNRNDSTHAEVSAILNLPCKGRNKKLYKINIIVIRTSLSGKVGNSKPCFRCILNMLTLPQKRGYIIKNVYYSNENGQIIESSPQELLDNGNYHVSRYYRNNNYQHKLLKEDISVR